MLEGTVHLLISYPILYRLIIAFQQKLNKTGLKNLHAVNVKYIFIEN